MKHLVKGSLFIRQVSLLAGGTALAQIINLLILPILTRLYTPEDFGVFAVMTACAALGGVLVSLRYENAILAVDSMALAKLGMYSVFSISLLMSLLILIIFSSVAVLTELRMIYYLVGVLAIGFSLVSAWTQALYFYCNRKSEYKKMTKGRVYGALCLALISTTWGVYLNSFWGLLLGSFSGMLINFMYLFYVNKDVTLKELYVNRKLLIGFWSENRRFPKFLVLSSLIDRTGSQGYLLLFTKVFGEAVSGALSLYNKVASLPSVLIGAAIGDVFKRNASELLRSNAECEKLFKKTASTLALLAVVPFFVLLFFGPFIFSFVFGDQWVIAGTYAQILSPVFFMGFVISPLSTLIYLEDNQKYDLVLQVVLVCLLAVTLTLAMLYSDAYMAVMAYAVSYITKYIIEATICWNIANGKLKRVG